MQPMESWPKSKVMAWKEMWESEAGKDAREYFAQVVQRTLESATETNDKNEQLRVINQAGGMRIIAGLIELGIQTANEMAEKEGKD